MSVENAKKLAETAADARLRPQVEPSLADPEDGTPTRGHDDDEDRLVEELTRRLREGDRAVQEELFRLTHSQLHILARRQMRGQPKWHSLQATALVNEAYLKLFGREPIACRDMAHLMRAAARAMDQVLADHARAKLAQKRAGPGRRVELTSALAEEAEEVGSHAYLEFSDEVARLERTRPDMARALLMRYVLGLPLERIAGTLGQPQRTFERDFAAASALVASRLA